MEYLSSNVIKKMIIFFADDVIRINHALKVYSFAKSIGDIEGLVIKEQAILEIAAILHDVGIKISEEKYNSAAAHYQELEGPPIAIELLKEFDLEVDIVKRVCFLIGNHHTYKNIDAVDFQILVEADFLLNIFECDMNQIQIKAIKEKYIKTSTAALYINTLYKS